MFDRWMNNTLHIENLRIDELILPGSHDSGYDKKAPNAFLPQEITQDVSPQEQVAAGVRVLDLRVEFYSSKPVGRAHRFQIFHMTSSGRTVSVDILDMVNDFYDTPSTKSARAREIFILDFHEFKNFTPQAHQELCELINSKIGYRSISKDLRHLTLDQLWNQHPRKTVVIAYNHFTQNSDFWPGVEQKWSGDNVMTTQQLKAFMDEVATQYKPSYVLRSIQCAKYVLPFFVPDDFSNKIDTWFESNDENSYIQKFFIINTDWTTRSRIVLNCLHANQFRGRQKKHPQ
jgi:hypothetical protein